MRAGFAVEVARSCSTRSACGPERTNPDRKKLEKNELDDDCQLYCGKLVGNCWHPYHGGRYLAHDSPAFGLLAHRTGSGRNLLGRILPRQALLRCAAADLLGRLHALRLVALVEGRARRRRGARRVAGRARLADWIDGWRARLGAPGVADGANRRGIATPGCCTYKL